MFYARTNKPGTQDSLALVLSLLWQVGSYVTNGREVLEILESPGILFLYFPGLESSGK